LVWVKLVIEVGKKHLGINVSAEAFRAFSEFGWPGGVLWLRTEVKAKTEMRAVVGWWGEVSAEVVAG
jgi:hypothetical protein